MTEELLRMVANRIEDLYVDLAYLDRGASFRVPLKRQLREAFAMKAALLAKQSAEG